MFKDRLSDLIREVMGSFDGQVELSNIDDSKPRVTTIYLVFGVDANSGGTDLPPLDCDDLDWKTDEQIKLVIRDHVEAYLSALPATH